MNGPGIVVSISLGWEPWSSGIGRRLTSKRLWVRIPASGWTFFHIGIAVKIVTFV